MWRCHLVGPARHLHSSTGLRYAPVAKNQPPLGTAGNGQVPDPGAGNKGHQSASLDDLLLLYSALLVITSTSMLLY